MNISSSLKVILVVLIAMGCGAIAAAPTYGCSFVTSAFGDPILGGDGLIHWTAPGWMDGRGDWDYPHLSKHWYWLTQPASAGSEPEARRFDPPPSLAGAGDGLVRRVRLQFALPDGAAWWSVECADDSRPHLAACDSWILVGPAGEALGRVSAPRAREIAPGPGRSLRFSNFVQARNATGRSLDRNRLALWRAVPQPLEAFDQRTEAQWWSEDYRLREAQRPRDGWELQWETQVPFTKGESEQRDWNISRWAFDRSRTTLAVLAEGSERIRLGVFQVDGAGPSQERVQLESIYQRSFPMARSGLSTNEDGALVLADAWSMAVSSEGVVAMGQWQIFEDCSKPRPPGLLVFDRRGEMIADIRYGAEPGQVEAIVFDAQNRVAVAGAKLRMYSTDRQVEREILLQPQRWEETVEHRIERARNLTGSSPVSEWVELYGVLESGHPGRERIEQARAIIVAGWLEVDQLLSAPRWLELAEDLCSAHPRAAGAALRRFQAARGDDRFDWLHALTYCFEQPPAASRGLIRELVDADGGDSRWVLERVLSSWPDAVSVSGMATQWSVVEDAVASNDHAQTQRAKQAGDKLLAAFDGQREVFEEKLRGSVIERAAASQVLLSSLESWSLEYTPPRQAAARAALLEAARDWVEGAASAKSAEETAAAPAPAGSAGRQRLTLAAEVGGLLLVGFDAWPGVGAPGDNEGKPFGSTFTASRLRETLRAAREGQAEQVRGGERMLWGVVAVGRLLMAHAVRAPGEYGAQMVPAPEDIGLPRDEVLALWRASMEVDLLAAQSRRRAEAVFNQAEQFRHILARSVGQDAQRELLQMALSVTAGRTHNAALWDLVPWMREHIESFPPGDVATVLELLAADENSGWQSGMFLDAVVRGFPSEHRLHRRARNLFRAHIDEAVTMAARTAPSERPRGYSRTDMLPQMIMHLFSTGHSGAEASPILSELSVTDARALTANAGSEFGSWLYLLTVTGPWPEAVPKLERMLEGNGRVGAAMALAHVQHSKALEVLLEGNASHHELPMKARALARYGARGIHRVLAGETNERLVAEMLADPALTSSLRTDAQFSSYAKALQRELEADLQSGQWPDLATVLILDAAGNDTWERVLQAVETLPTDAESVRAFLFQSGPGASSSAVLQLGRIASRASTSQAGVYRQAVLRMVEDLAKSLQTVRWVEMQARQ